jgi:RNA polymerase subunit RPABC4/transcription elongation factor Spt4
MGFINHQLGIREKVSNEGFPLWRKCSEGDQEALTKMLNYNIGDVFATEDLFYKLRPYIKNINMALYNEIIEAQCPVCGSLDLTSEGFYYTSAGRWESMRCNNCKSLSRKKQNLLSTEKKKSLLINS